MLVLGKIKFIFHFYLGGVIKLKVFDDICMQIAQSPEFSVV